jgi:hypothetical protein
MPEVIRAQDCENSPKNATAEEIALALMGVGELSGDRLAENAVWDGAHGAVSGRAAIGAALGRVAPADRIRVEQVVTHGRAGSVSGRITRTGQTRLYCHVIRFTSAAQAQVAQIVSFEHPGGKTDV